MKNTIEYFTKGKIMSYKTLDAVDVVAYAIDGKTFYLYKLEVEYVVDGVTTTDVTKEDSCAIMNSTGQMLRVIKKDTGITANLLDFACVVSKELAIDGLTVGAYVDQSVLRLTGTNLTSGGIVPEGDKDWTRYSLELIGGEVYDFNGHFEFSALDKPLTYDSLIRNTYGNDVCFENIHDRIDFIYVRDVKVNGSVKDLLLYSAGDSQAKFDQKQQELMNE